MLNSRADVLLMARQRAQELIRQGQPGYALAVLDRDCSKNLATRDLTNDYDVMLPGLRAVIAHDKEALWEFVTNFGK